MYISKPVALIARNIVSFILMSSMFFSAQAASTERGSRYCEVIVGHGLTASVYSSFKLNSCPSNLWSRVNIQKLKKESRSSFVYLNGPRHFLFDDFKYTKPSFKQDVKYFGGIKMRKIAVVHVTFTDMVKGFVPYRTHKVKRTTTYTFKAGTPIYEIVTADNQVYVMQSYSDEVTKQSQDSLANLGSKLRLPSGWKFKSGVLTEDKSISTQNNLAVVMQDRYKNTYQRTAKDLLK